jgi:creatinine amidohydrolase
MATDTLIANSLCSALGEELGVDVAPALPFSASGEHDGFPGLLSLGTEVTVAVLQELVRSARATWRHVLLVSGHGGNLEALTRVTERARYEGDDVVAWVPRDPGGDAHAGRSETSVMLHLHPELVGLAEAEPALPSDWTARVVNGGVIAVSASGVLGDPSQSSPATGRELWQRWYQELADVVTAWGTAV